MKNINYIIIIFIFMLASTNSFAQSKDNAYGGIQGQIVFTETEGEASSNAQALANLCVCTVTYEWEETTLSARIFAGYKLSKKFGLEVGYFNTSSVDIKYSGTASGGAWNATQSAEASGVDLSAIIKFAENYFGRIGLHNSRIDELAGFTAAGFTYTAAGSSSGSGFLIGGGIEKPMGTKSFWNVELVYYDSLGGVSDATATFLNFGIGMNF